MYYVIASTGTVFQCHSQTSAEKLKDQLPFDALILDNAAFDLLQYAEIKDVKDIYS